MVVEQMAMFDVIYNSRYNDIVVVYKFVDLSYTLRVF